MTEHESPSPPALDEQALSDALKTRSATVRDVAYGEGVAATEQQTEATETEAVTMQGRLGRDPWFGGSEDSPIAGFPLAINAANRTVWHKVVVFDETATKLAAQLQRGDVRKAGSLQSPARRSSGKI